MRDKELADLARTILKDPRVKVTIGGHESWFDHIIVNGKPTVHINIARMEATPEGILLMCGLVFHEAGHMHTTGGKSSGILGDFENIIEDVRTEGITISERPGTAYDLEAVTDYYQSKQSLAPQQLAHALVGKTMAYGRGRILNQKSIMALETVCDEWLEEAFGQSFIDEIEEILKMMPTLTSTDDVREMAKKLVDLLLEEQKKQQQQQKGGKSQEDDEPAEDEDSSQSPDGGGKGNGADKDDEEQSGSSGPDEDDAEQNAPSGDDSEPDQDPQSPNDGGKGDGEEGDDGQAGPDGDGDTEGDEEENGPDGTGEDAGQDGQDGKQNGTGKGSSPKDDGDGEPDGSPADADSNNRSPDAGGNLGGGAGGGGNKRPTAEEIEEILANSTDYGDISKLIVDDLNKMAGDGYGEDTYSGIPEWPEIGVLTYLRGKLDESGAMVASSRMRAKLGSLLFSSKRCPISYGTSGRKLAVNRLVRMATGDPKIFQKKVENAAPNSAVAIVLDTSGSMGLNSQLQFGGTTRALVANKTAFALNACLFSLAGVKCCTLEFSNKDRNDGSKCDVNVVCEFGTKPNSERFNINPFDGTPTDQAIWAARGLLLQRPEPRKIILLVTDGEPNDADATDGATTRTERDGIEIAALGIMCDRVKDYWKNNRVINDISDLPQAMFGVMEELLTKRGR